LPVLKFPSSSWSLLLVFHDLRIFQSMDIELFRVVSISNSGWNRECGFSSLIFSTSFRKLVIGNHPEKIIDESMVKSWNSPVK
jgi:hypothetical protein